MTDRLRLLVQESNGPVKQDEIDRAIEELTELLRQIAELSGHPVGELARSEVFDVHTLAYVITLRRTSAQVHERAAGLLLRLLHRTENHRELALRALGHLYEEAMPEPPGLHMVRS